MLQRLHLQIGYNPGRMYSTYDGILRAFPEVRRLSLRISIHHDAIVGDWEIGVLERFLECMPTCSRIRLGIYQHPAVCLHSRFWKVLVRGLGGAQGRRPWGSQTRCSIGADIRTEELREAWSMLLTSLSMLTPMLSLESQLSQASNNQSHLLGEYDYRETAAPYLVQLRVPDPFSNPNKSIAEYSTAVAFMGLQITRLELVSRQTGYHSMRGYLTSCRETLTSLALAEVDRLGHGYLLGLELPKLKYLKLVRISTEVAESLLDGLKSPALHYLEYEGMKYDNLRHLLLEYLPDFLEAHSSFRRFDLHVKCNASTWYEESLVIGQLYQQLQRKRRITMTLNYRGSFVLPTLQEHAFMAQPLRTALRTMAIRLKRDEELDWSDMVVTHYPNLLTLQLIIREEGSEGFTLFSQFFRHFRFPALEILCVNLQDPAFKPYLEHLVQDILAFLDLKTLSVQLAAEDTVIAGLKPNDALTAFQTACKRLAISFHIHHFQSHLALPMPHSSL